MESLETITRGKKGGSSQETRKGTFLLTFEKNLSIGGGGISRAKILAKHFQRRGGNLGDSESRGRGVTGSMSGQWDQGKGSLLHRAGNSKTANEPKTHESFRRSTR